MRKVVIALLVVFILINVANGAYIFNAYHHVLGNQKIVGSVTSTGSVSLQINIPPITINSPTNSTYYFEIGQTLILPLNVTTSADIVSWRFTHVDMFHGVTLNASQTFTPEINISAVRRSNKIFVDATTTANQHINATVYFTVAVNDTPPTIDFNHNDLYWCEGDQPDYSDITIQDIDEDILAIDLSPKDPFFLSKFGENKYPPYYYEFSSHRLLTKSDLGYHEYTLSADDAPGGPIIPLVTNVVFNRTILEVNTVPSISAIPTRTLYLSGDNSSLLYQTEASDNENNGGASGNLSFTITFQVGTQFFSIGNKGLLNVTANSTLVGSYNTSVCVTDNGLRDPEGIIAPNCPGALDNLTECTPFLFTILNENRKPTIIRYYSTNRTLSVHGEIPLEFSVVTYDADDPSAIAPPDVQWYVDGSATQFDQGISVSNYTYTFPCGMGGLHSVGVMISDGLLNDSIDWNVTVLDTSCFVPEGSIGGGASGAAGAGFCAQKWGCKDWNTCSNTANALAQGTLEGDLYRTIQESCDSNGLHENTCGFQTRSCFDANMCNYVKNLSKPEELQSCLYTNNPSCNDRIKNCHDRKCEFLIDCGGPCGLCATCSDGVQNQGELGIDCGGPCPTLCAPPTTLELIQKTKMKYFLFVAVFVLMIVIIMKLLQIAHIRRELLLSAMKKKQKERQL